MTAIASILSTNSAMPPTAGTGTGATPGAGTPALATFLDLLAPSTPADIAMPGERQDAAASGKSLPPEERGRDEDALAWLGVMPPPTMALAAPVPVAMPGVDASGTVAPTPAMVVAQMPTVAGTRDVVPTIAVPRRFAPAGASVAAVSDGSPPGSVTAAPRSIDAAPLVVAAADAIRVADSRDATPRATATGDAATPAPSGHGADTPRSTAGQSGDRTPATAPAPFRAEQPVATAPAAAPAGRVFAEAIHRALGDRDPQQSADAVPLAAPAPVSLAGGVVATGAAQQGALDMRHEHWPQAMIERIATLRDMAAENDTRLRLSPDMLGAIDVSLKRDGDAVQVQITAEHAQTRQLLADAQPRLTELAEARGVKLQLAGGQGGAGSQAGGHGNQSGGGDAPRHHPSTPAPTRRQTAARDDARSTDQRIA
jgi:hypothetical protein